MGIYVYVFFLNIFLMWTIFKVFIEFVTILLLFYVLVFWPRGMWDLSSLTRDQTCTPCLGRQSLKQRTTGEVPKHFLTWHQPSWFFQEFIALLCLLCLFVISPTPQFWSAPGLILWTSPFYISTV